MTHTTMSDDTTVVRTSRGLSIAGTRITLYRILDYVYAGWTSKLIRDRLNLTDHQITAALDYIAVHQTEVETEYQQIIRDAEAIQSYWEEQNRERMAAIAARPPKPEQAAIRAKLAAAKAKLNQK
ncbi:MAG: DUF433 domain-containing protein [Oscillochloridaceae bacterium umkhey_bin13]